MHTQPRSRIIYLFIQLTNERRTTDTATGEYTLAGLEIIILPRIHNNIIRIEIGVR